MEQERQFVWRNYAVQLGPDRFSRDHWTLEPWRYQAQPRRSSEGKSANGKHIKPKPPPLKKAPAGGVIPKYSPEQCQQRKGSYELLRTEPSGKTFRVVAVCRGKWCGGAERIFSAWGWCQQNPKLQACGKCTYESRKDERLARRDALKAAGLPIYKVKGRAL